MKVAATDKWPPFLPSILDDYPLDVYEFRVLMRICRREDGKNDRVHDESNRTTAEQCGMSESKVRYAKALLVAAGLVTVTRHNGRTDEYRINHPDGWADPSEIVDLRKEVRARRQRSTTAVSRTAAPGTAAPGTGHRGTRNRTPRHQEPDTAVPGADEGSPLKVLPERTPPAPPLATDREQHERGGAGEDRVEAHLDALERRLPDREARNLDRRKRQLRAALAAADPGWTPDALARAVLNLDEKLGPLDRLNDPSKIAGALAYRIRKLGPSPSLNGTKPAKRQADVDVRDRCPECNGTGQTATPGGGADLIPCPTCSPVHT